MTKNVKKKQLGPYPMETMKRVDKPTIKITDNIKRFDEREHGFGKVMRGELGEAAQREMERFVPKFPLGGAFFKTMAPLAQSVDGEVARTRAPLPNDPSELSRHIKQLGYFLRSDIVGICELPQYAVYSHDAMGKEVNLDHKYAIIVVVDQNYETMLGSTGDDWISGSQSFIGYSNTALISCVMADYIRRLGYRARAHHALNYQVVVPPLLVLAGIGEMSRAGIVLNPFLGARFKAAVVTTDLPLEPDKPIDFGLQEFCEKCLKCAVECHANAIPKGAKEMYNGYETWHFDAEKCSKFRIMNPHGSACGRCIKVCPWNKSEGWTHDLVRWMVKRVPVLDSFLVKMDDAWGYGKQDKRYKWWYDLEEVDGVIKVPEK
ncbi:MAG: reductive dehalogenase [Dehalococcoidales bacterium]|nr:reductive dehalogenase [Dehalococcoidales bacterium]